MVDGVLGQLAVLSGIVLASIGVYGFAASQNLIRQLLSIEVLFNAILLLVIVIFSSNPIQATLFSIILISIVSGEVIVIVAVIVRLFRMARSLESFVLEEEGV